MTHPIDKHRKSGPPHLYKISLCIIVLGVWVLAVIMCWDVLPPLSRLDSDMFSQPDLALALLLSLAMILGFFTLPSLLASALFAALLFWITRKFPQRGSQIAVLTCSIFYASGPIIWAATTDKEATNAFGIQFLLIPILSFVCVVAGRAAANSDMGRV